MSEQPEALYLADELEKLLILGDLGPNGNTAKTIRQLRRLHALCEEMGKALLDVRDYVVFMKGRGHQYQICIDAALAKWKESK